MEKREILSQSNLNIPREVVAQTARRCSVLGVPFHWGYSCLRSPQLSCYVVLVWVYFLFLHRLSSQTILQPQEDKVQLQSWECNSLRTIFLREYLFTQYSINSTKGKCTLQTTQQKKKRQEFIIRPQAHTCTCYTLVFRRLLVSQKINCYYKSALFSSVFKYHFIVCINLHSNPCHPSRMTFTIRFIFWEDTISVCNKL